MVALLLLSAVAVAWFGLTLAGMTPFTYPEPAVAAGAFLFLGLNAAFLAGGAMRIRAPEFGPDQRRGVRLSVALRGTIDGVLGSVEDLSLRGAGVTMSESGAEIGDTVEFVILLPDHTVTLAAVVRRRREVADGVEVGIEFDTDQVVDIADLALALLSTDVDEHPGTLPAQLAGELVDLDLAA
jgi:hypothetical protein